MKHDRKDKLKLAAALVIGVGTVTTAVSEPPECDACDSEQDACYSGADAAYDNCIAFGQSPASCDSQWANAILDCDSAASDCETQWSCC